MDEQIIRYAKELMSYRQESKPSRDALEGEVIRLSEQLALIQTYCLPKNYCASVNTQKTGILGKLIVLAKRLVRKATFFIVRDLTHEIAEYEQGMIKLCEDMIELQNELIVELINTRKNNA